jgi:hypothetical protein
MSLAPLIDEPIVVSALDTEAKTGSGEGRGGSRAPAETRNRMRYGVIGLLAAFFIGAALMLRQKLARFGVKKSIAPFRRLGHA